MLMDVSHLNDGGFWDVARMTQGPLIASHSNCRQLCDVPRNLTDDQLKAIRDSGGTNMLDTRTVQWSANREDYHKLVFYLEENSREYWNFIMTGEAPMADEDEED